MGKKRFKAEDPVEVKVEVLDEMAQVAASIGNLSDGPVKTQLQKELSNAEKLSGSERSMVLAMIERASIDV